MCQSGKGNAETWVRRVFNVRENRWSIGLIWKSAAAVLMVSRMSLWSSAKGGTAQRRGGKNEVETDVIESDRKM